MAPATGFDTKIVADPYQVRVKSSTFKTIDYNGNLFAIQPKSF